jgi:glutamine---fructose-6-phosphate transaminase (isomerizing)
MCGIFGVVGKEDKAANVTFSGLKDIEYRGYDSWGVAYVQNDGFVINKKIGFLPEKMEFPASNLSLGHTRWATHGGVTDENAHPHTDCSGKLVIVHNGIVENYLELKKELKSHVFKSETDTEVIIHLIEVEFNKSQNLKNSVSSIFKRLHGLNAIVVSDGKEIISIKTGSPVVLGKGDNALYIASDPNAILPHTKELLFLEDNQLVCLGADLTLFDNQTNNSLTPNFTTVDWDYSSSSLANYPHFMIKEINEQPKVLRTIAQNAGELEKVAEMIKDAYGTYFIGCGTAAYSCLLGTYLFSKFSKKHVNFSIGSEFNYVQDFLTDKSLLIAVSQSGESIDVVEPVGAAKKKGAKIVSLVNVLGSTLYRMANYPVLLQAGVEKGVASTKAFLAMASSMIMLSMILEGKKEEAKEILEKSANEIDKILKQTDSIKSLADKIHDRKHIYVLGRGLSYPIALESALKIKEISYIHAEGFPGGELKHGPIALIEKGTPVLVYVPNDETKDAVLANAMEVKARGAYVIGVGVSESEAFDFFFKVEDTGASSVLPHVVFAQLLAYYLTLKLDLNPDKPRNLAKSVVVR